MNRIIQGSLQGSLKGIYKGSITEGGWGYLEAQGT